MQQLEMPARSPFELEMFVSDPAVVSLSDSDLAKLKVSFDRYFELLFFHEFFFVLSSTHLVVITKAIFSSRTCNLTCFLDWKLTRRKLKIFAASSIRCGSV